MNVDTQPLVVPAPAKLNLFLHITGRTDDGYHLLQTIFQLLDYGDSVELCHRADGAIQLIDPVAGIADADNIVIKAARLLQSHSASLHGAAIKLTKHIPIGGGLGGGSSDAASTLLGLNQLWGLNLSLVELADIGLQLGADVPVFVRGRSSFAEGIGDRLQAVTLPEKWFVVVKPPVSVSTATIFAHPRLTRDTRPIRIAAFFDSGAKPGSGAQVANLAGEHTAGLQNDCEAVVRAEYPAVNQALNWLSKHGSARLTGTGSCIFAGFDTEEQARTVYQAIPEPLSGFVAKSCNASTAHSALGLDTTGHHSI